ncbi:MAG: capsular biosynthesis protein [Prosthecobacter sp.]|uniref:hypothetical protein n=1 Tax=Prosthecobacter sp. TaxID=1965333 RepID=UPI0025CC4D13|nr:hypothetical protein [Prosthecobacter sp.]MCF7785795.1 capsular biosynthesis protein [Prosthecobacter sp.]
MKTLQTHLAACAALFFSAFSECPAQIPTSDTGEISHKIDYEPELKIILENPNFEIRRKLLVEFAERIGTTDPQNAWLMRNKIMNQPDLLSFASSLMKIWGRDQPLKAVELTLTNPDGEFRMFITNAALAGWASKDHFKAMEWASKNLSPFYRRTALATIGQIWALKNPVEAIEWGSNLRIEVERVFYIAEILTTWTNTNPYEAVQWASKLPLGKFHDLMVSQVIFTWVNYYPIMAVEWLLSTPEHQWLLPATLAKWTKFDHLAAINSLTNIQDQKLKLSCQIAIIDEWAYFNPEAACKWASTQLKDEQITNAIKTTIGNWAADYPLEVLKWAQDIKLETNSSAPMEAALESWARADFKACLTWVNQQKKGHERDIGLSKVSDVLMETEPRTAADIALSISDLALQKKSLLNVLETWKLNSPENSENWIKNHPHILKLLNQ